MNVFDKADALADTAQLALCEPWRGEARMTALAHAAMDYRRAAVDYRRARADAAICTATERRFLDARKAWLARPVDMDDLEAARLSVEYDAAAIAWEESWK